MSAFAGSNGSCRSPYHERAKKVASKSPGPSSSSSKPRRFVIGVPPPTVLRPETAVPRNSGYSDQSPGKAKLDVREPNTPTKTSEVHKENNTIFSHNDRAKHCETLPSRKGRVATPIKTPRPCSAATPLFSPSKPYCASRNHHQKVLVERPAHCNAHVGTANSGTGEKTRIRRLPGKIEVNIAQLQTPIEKFMQHDENLATPQTPENSSSKVLISDETSQDVHLENTSFSPLPQLLQVDSGGVAFTVGNEQPVQKVLSPKLDFLRNQLECQMDLLQNTDFGSVGTAPGSSLTEILASPKADIMVISEHSKGGATRVESTSETAESILLSNDDMLTARMSCNNMVELEEVKAPISSECMSQYVKRGYCTSMIAEEIPPIHQESLPANTSCSNVVDTSSEINESGPLSDQEDLTAKTSCDNVVDAQEVTEKTCSGFPPPKVCFIAEEFTHGKGESVTPGAALQTIGIQCPVDLDIEEEDEIDNPELSLGSRFLTGMVFGSLLLGFVFGLLASGSQGLLPQKWHVNPLASSWQKSSIRKPVLEMTKSIEGLWQDCSHSSSFYPVVDLISIHKGYGHVRTQVYSLVQQIQYNHFRGFADAYVGSYPSLSLSATTGDHQNLHVTKSLGGPWNHLTGILHHFRTVCSQLWIKISQISTNIVSHGFNVWVSWKPKLDELSTDAVLNAGGESTDGVQVLLAPLIDSGYPEGIDSKAEYEDDNMGLMELLQMTTPALVVEMGTMDALLLDTLIEEQTLLDTPGMEGFEKDLYSILINPVVGETFLNLQEEAALDMPSNVAATTEDNLSAFVKADEVHAGGTIDTSVTTKLVSSNGDYKASISVDVEHLTTELSTEMEGMAYDSSAGGSEMCFDASIPQTDSPGLTSFVDEDNDAIRDDNVDELLVQELLVEGIDGAETSRSQFVIIAIGSFGVAVAVSFLFKQQRASAQTKRETKSSFKEDHKCNSPAAIDEQPPVPTVKLATRASVYHNLPKTTCAISSPAYKVLAPGKFGLQKFSYNRVMTPAVSAPTALARPASHMQEMPTVSAPTGFSTKLGYISDRTGIRTLLGTFMHTAPHLHSEYSMSSSGSASEISSSDASGSGSDTNSVIESQLSMMPDGSRPLGSFTAYEPVAINEGTGIEQLKLTPVRRSSRIRSQVASPAHFA
ncbi:unnamed protein product [Sphagnum tenellum]